MKQPWAPVFLSISGIVVSIFFFGLDLRMRAILKVRIDELEIIEPEVWEKAGLKGKMNMVPMRSSNHDQILPMLDYCLERDIELRYIELMIPIVLELLGPDEGERLARRSARLIGLQLYAHTAHVLAVDLSRSGALVVERGEIRADAADDLLEPKVPGVLTWIPESLVKDVEVAPILDAERDAGVVVVCGHDVAGHGVVGRLDIRGDRIAAGWRVSVADCRCRS